MKVLLANQSTYVYGGAETVIVRLANYLSKHGIENALVTPSLHPDIEKDLVDTEIIISPKSCSPHSEMRSIHRGIKENESRFDVINPHNYPAEMAVFGCKKPVVWQCNEPILAMGAGIISKINLALDKLVVKRNITEVVVADEFNSYRFERIYHKKPIIIPYGIDTEYFNLDREVNPDVFKILQVGMVQPYKNQLESLQIVNALKNKIPNISITFAGWQLPEYKMILDEYIRKNGLQNIVTFLEHVGKPYLKQLYATHDLMLHPIKAQGGWLSPFEALCTGLPIIVSNEFTAASIIIDNSIGVVSNSDNYASDIMKVYHNRDKYHKQALKGKQWANSNLTWDKYCKGMINVFKKVIK